MQQELPGYNMELVKKRLRELQEKYEKEIKPREKDYNEPNTKMNFIEPILNVLNWDTENKDEVDAEFYIKNKRSSGSADYALKINGEVKILLEAKSFDKDLETGFDIVHGMRRTYVEQLINYAFDLNKHMNTKIDYCILTNGKEWRVYYVHYQGVSFDRKLVFVLKIEEFLDKFLKFWSLEKGNFQKGDLDQFLKDDERLKIDKKAVNSLLYCKKILVDSMVKDYNENKRDMKYVVDKLINKSISDAPETFPKFYEMPEEERLSKFILEASSNIINKILFIRIIEDKGFVRPKLTKQFVREWKETWSTDKLQNIMKLFKDACEQAEGLYNGGLFELNPYDTLPYDNNTIENIMGLLGDFNFEEIDADVIGRIYEIYLGTLLSVEEEIRGKKRTKLSSDFTERKKLGQYYTPKFIVDYIVKNTLGKLLEGKTPEEVSKIKILDPACGSGSFLIRAFDYLKDYYVRYNDQQMEKVRKNGVNNINNYIENGKIIDYNHKILKENLHGVDLNYLSTQVCSINLWLRALEKDKKLEKLSKNILHGNSLISGIESKEELAKYKNELKEITKLRDRIKEYYGKELGKREKDELEEMESKLKEFKEKTNIPKEEQGFDVVIGNPPYGAKFNEKEKQFLKHEFTAGDIEIESYILFIEKALNLLKENCYFGFIIPSNILTNVRYEAIRKYILSNTCVLSIVDLKSNVFEDAAVDSCIIILKKTLNREEKEKNTIHCLILNKAPEKIDDSSSKIFKQKYFEQNPQKLFNIYLTKDKINVIKKIEGSEVTDLDNIIDIARGIEFGYESKKIKDSKINENYKKIVAGRCFGRYWLNFENKYVIFDDNNTKIYKDKSIYEVEKIILRRIGHRLMATYDEDKFYNVCDVYDLWLKDKSYDLKYLLGIMNSKLLSFYLNTKFISVKRLFPKIPIKNIIQLPIKKKDNKYYDKIIKEVNNILDLKKNHFQILKEFNDAINNQTISDEKACKFEHYWRNSDLYDFSKETLAFANKTEAKIVDMDVKEEKDKLIIYTTNISSVQNKEFKNIKTIELTIKNETLRKFLFYSFKKYVNEKRGSFGSGIILEVIRKIPIPVYVVNIKMNLDRIKQVMKEFEHETNDLWKIDGKTYNNLTEIEEDIEKTDKEIDDMVYDLYNITKEERKIIEESLR